MGGGVGSRGVGPRGVGAWLDRVGCDGLGQHVARGGHGLHLDHLQAGRQGQAGRQAGREAGRQAGRQAGRGRQGQAGRGR